ncbi:uncharacterized protein LOC132607677 [Lycium barbarum]|uniref:uncharacterized protein LOC132607677 n=1 Tax=Lycium barbarum TaxID=112863 RepID=UPI00293ED356|nr:uncharacterized protein LOC132607677 [Lycium barbarum]
MQIRRIQGADGNWIEEEERIIVEAIRYYTALFTKEDDPKDFEILNHLPRMIFEDDNLWFEAKPTKEEVKAVVFQLNGESAGGPDGFNGVFIKFAGKLLERILIHGGLVSKLSDIISLNQSGFVKDRSIVENILLTQEIVSDIRLRTKDANVIIKLDMAKAYDRVSWLFLTKVFRQMGFSKKIIDMVYRIVNNNWYSMLVNGQQQGFFQSPRGVKQGDSLSPTLFILAAEVLSRSLNALHQKVQFRVWIMEILKNYEQTSGQNINMDKSIVYMHNNVTGDISITVEIVTGINRKEFPFMYLGCPIYHCRRKKKFLNALILKIMNRLQGWKGKMLSFGGRAILTKHVLQSMPIHMLSAVNPSIRIIRQIHKMFAQFFWSNTIGGTSRHWVAWNKWCVPTPERGLGFRSLHDVSLALFYKLWWNFKTKPTLWSAYMTNKYCRKEHAIVVNPGDTYDERIQNVKEVVVEERWNREKLIEVLTEGIIEHIVENITPAREERDTDRPWWIPDTRGEFSIKSTWDFIRLRGPQVDSYRFVWIKGLPFKISFFLWRCWKYKIPTDDVLKDEYQFGV